MGCGKQCKDAEPEIPGCQPKPYKKEYLVSNLGEAVDYLAFKPGSWWIYQHNRTLEYDTIEVVRTEIYRDTVYGSHPTGVKRWLDQELFLTHMYSTNRKYIDRYLTYGRRPFYPSQIFYMFDTNYINILKDFDIYSNCFQLPLVKEGPYPSGRLNLHTVNNKTYNNILWFFDRLSSTVPYCDRSKFYMDPSESYHYWAKDIGLIELKYYGYNAVINASDSASWNLVDYKVTKYSK